MELVVLVAVVGRELELFIVGGLLLIAIVLLGVFRALGRSEVLVVAHELVLECLGRLVLVLVAPDDHGTACLLAGEGVLAWG